MVTTPLTAPAITVAPTPSIFQVCLMLSKTQPNVANLTALFVPCLQRTGPKPLQSARTPSILATCTATWAKFNFSSPRRTPAADRSCMILVFNASPGVTTRTDSIAPAASPATALLHPGFDLPKVVFRSQAWLCVKDMKRMPPFAALLMASAEQPAYRPRGPEVFSVSRST